MGEYEEPYVRNVLEFLEGHEWTQNVTIFMQSHCKVFVTLQRGSSTASSIAEVVDSKLEDYSHGQYEMFLTFQEWANEMVTQFVEGLGVSEKEFVAMCEAKMMDRGTSEELRERIAQLLDVIDAMTRFEYFVRLMETTNARMEREEYEQDQQLQYQLDMKEWDLQVTLSHSIIQGNMENVLTENDRYLVPWAQAVVALNDALQRAGMPGNDPYQEEQEIEHLTNQLMYERLQVEYMVAERLQESEENQQQQQKQQGDGVAEEEEEETTLQMLLNDSGKIQLAINQQRSLLQNGLISDQDYEQIYLLIREELKKKPHNKKAMEQRLKTQFPVLRKEVTFVGSLLDLIWLEDRLRKIHKHIQDELSAPGSVQYVNRITTPSAAREEREREELHIDTSQEMQNINNYFQQQHQQVSTPKEARDAIKQMQENLRKITQEREMGHMRMKMNQLAATCTPKNAKQIQDYASKVAEYEAIHYAENGQILHMQIDGYDSDCTQEDEDDDEDGGQHDQENSDADDSVYKQQGEGKTTCSKGTGLRIKANEDHDNVGSLLKETEKLRRQLLLRATPTPSSAYASRAAVQSPKPAAGFVQLNSPKRFNHQQQQQQQNQQHNKRDVIVNPTSLRFLAGQMNK